MDNTARSRMERRELYLPLSQVRTYLMLTLTFTTGVNDAVGYLGLDRVFTGNMTGNVIILGMAIAGGDGLPVVGPALALLGFMAGASCGGRFLRDATQSWSGRTTIALSVVGMLLLLLGSIMLGLRGIPSHRVGVLVTTTVAAAMGLQAAAARVVAVKDVTTVVVTSTITGLAADSILGTGKGGASTRRAAAVVLLISGAFVGALVQNLAMGAGLVLAGAIVSTAALIGNKHARGHSSTPS